jgi:SecD/SecF fusion protein
VAPNIISKIIRNALITIAVLAFMGFSIFPPEKQLRLGKDLSGGVSLTYTVQVAPGEDSKDVLARTIDVLKRRVDPQGLSEISMVAQGRDRIEITMPLPGEDVKRKKKAFEDALNELSRSAINPGAFEQIMRAPAGERQQKMDALAAGNAGRKALIEAAATSSDESNAARAAFEEAQKKGVTGADLDALVEKAAQADLKYDQARAKVLQSALSGAEVRRVLQLSDTNRSLFDNTTSQQVVLPSPREKGIKRLREGHPEFSGELDKIEALYAEYVGSRRSLDDPADLQRLIRNAGVLSFRITLKPGTHPDELRLRQELRERGPRNVRSTDARWYKINQIDNWYSSVQELQMLEGAPQAFLQSRGYVGEEYDGEYFILAWDTATTRLTTAEGDWGVSSASEGRDELGRPSIAFAMNTAGAVKLGNLTRGHVGEQMAVLLDDEVYTAPNLNSAISKNGQIMGDFSKTERDYVIRVLSAGSLQAKLSPEPISVSALGPELGADNLEQGVRAGVIALITVSVFMVFYYFQCGVIAVVALMANALTILGAMAMNKAAFTMPGIAGVILTFGMAVDSNVLIYERIREELLRGLDLKSATRLGFQKALASIVDGNVTNLIVCVVLGYTGTAEIKGFAITMSIGVLATLFAALVVSRLIFDVLLNFTGWKKTSMLPMAIPALQRMLTPNINWLKLRWIFMSISAAYVLLGLGAVVFRGEKMLDNEFRGGTQVTLRFKETAGGTREQMTRVEVETRVRELAKGGSGPLLALESAEVYPLNPGPDGVTSDQFVIKTVATEQGPIVDSIVRAFEDKLESKPALGFKGADTKDFRDGPVYRVTSKNLGQDIDRADVRDDVSAYLGGVAIVIGDIRPPVKLEALRDRLEVARSGSEFSDTLGRVRDIKILDGDENQVRSAVILSHDAGLSLFDNETRWETEVAAREWALVGEALTKASTPASVQSFSAVIAETFRAQAIVATILSFMMIGLYIWVRFKGARYSVAAVVALVHDVLTVLGLIALTEILYENSATEGVARSLGLLPFKIDLNMVAALLTIAGYSLNDTIIIMDRIRENRGKSIYATSAMINRAINETISRTLITGGMTLVSCIILYVYGGEGVRAFAFALTTGLIVGTYSSVAVAAPIVWNRGHDKAAAKEGVPHDELSATAAG